MQPDATFSVHVPVQFKRHGGRKMIILPDAEMQGQKAARSRDMTLVNGIAKAHRWQALYERGKHASLTEFIEKQGLNMSYAARVMNLNLLAPDIRKTILDGLQPRGLKLSELMKPFPCEWQEQRKTFGFAPVSD
jgi:hypothetical protein